MNLVRLPFTIGFGVARRVGGLGLTAVRAAADAAGLTDSSTLDATQPPPARPTGAAPSATPPPATSPGEAGALRPRPMPPGARPAVPETPQQPPPVGEEATRVHEAGDPDEPGPEIRVEGEPFPGYDRLRANEIIDRVRDADEATKARVRLYEGAGKKRRTVLDATER